MPIPETNGGGLDDMLMAREDDDQKDDEPAPSMAQESQLESEMFKNRLAEENE